MAFNNFYSPYQNAYNPYQQYQPNFQQQMQNQSNYQQSQQPIQQQIQNGGFISVRNEQEARNYPIAPGNSVTFKDENMPYVYVKTMGFSQLDRTNNTDYAKKDEITALWSEIEALKSKLFELTDKSKGKNEKSEVKTDE